MYLATFLNLVMGSNRFWRNSLGYSTYRFMLFANLKTILLLPFENVCLWCLTWSDPWKPPNAISIHSAFHSVILSKMLIYPHICLRVYAHNISFSWNILHPNISWLPPSWFPAFMFKSKIITSKWIPQLSWESFLHCNHSVTFCKLF